MVEEILRQKQPSFLKTVLGRFAFWVEATFGLYQQDSDSLKELVPKNEDEWIKELIIMYELLDKKVTEEKKNKKYVRLFLNRVFLDIWGICNMTNTKIPKSWDEALCLVSDSLKIIINRVVQEEEFGEIAYFIGEKLKIYKAAFRKPKSCPDWAYELFLLLEMAVSKNIEYSNKTSYS